jgi:hypothetical protein
MTRRRRCNLLKAGLLSNRKVVFSLFGIKMLSGFCSSTVGQLSDPRIDRKKKHLLIDIVIELTQRQK